MTIQEMRILLAYDSWATNRLFEALAAVPEDAYKRDLKTSHGSLHGTLVHIVAAQRIWLSRFAGRPETTRLTPQDAPSLATLKALWEETAAGIARVAAKLDDKKLLSGFEYVATGGKAYNNTYQQILQHLVNHGTYHRGQIASMMRQVGAEPVGTDLIAFYRHTAQPQRPQVH